MNNAPRISGRIIKLSPRGWGFIASRDIEFTRIFFHWTALLQNTLGFKELRIGMTAEFQPIQIYEKGWRAIHVRITDTNERVPVTEEQINEQSNAGTQV